MRTYLSWDGIIERQLIKWVIVLNLEGCNQINTFERNNALCSVWIICERKKSIIDNLSQKIFN